jgi:hypothetical protein
MVTKYAYKTAGIFRKDGNFPNIKPNKRESGDVDEYDRETNYNTFIVGV